MANNYKIYYNDSFVLITDDRAQMNENFTKVFDTPNAINNFLAQPEILFDNITNEQLFIFTQDPKKAFETLTNKVNIVLAGGGLVFNEHDEMLLIHRRGYWDLAKGKIDKGEEIITGAQREVTEETGVLIDSVETEPTITYHTYYLKGKASIKPTYWYTMKAAPNQTKLTPQAEEDIDDVRWVKKTELVNYKDGCHPLIWDLLALYAQ